MNRKFKALGLALFAALALSAVVASAAAAEGEYTAAEYPTTGTATSGLGNDVFTTEGGTVECVSHFEGTLTAASSELTVKATYSSCKAFGFASATVNMGSCDYLFTTPVLIGTHEGPPVNHTWTIPAPHVKCTNAANLVTIIAGNCEVKIGEHTPTGGHILATATTKTPAEPNDVDIKAAVTGIHYNVVKDGFLCPFAGTGAKTDGKYDQKNHLTLSSTNGKSITIS